MKKINLHSKKTILFIFFSILSLIIIGIGLCFFCKGNEPKYTIQDIDYQIQDLITQKFEVFAEGVEYYKSNGENVPSKTINQYITIEHPEIDIKIEYLKKLREELIQKEVIENLKK